MLFGGPQDGAVHRATAALEVVRMSSDDQRSRVDQISSIG